jgi:hypothetical protein
MLISMLCVAYLAYVVDPASHTIVFSHIYYPNYCHFLEHPADVLEN